MANSLLPDLIRKHEKSLLDDWLAEQERATRRGEHVRSADHRAVCGQFLHQLESAIKTGELRDITGGEWEPLRATLDEISRSRTAAGWSPTETATFVFSFKQPLFGRLRAEISDPNKLADEMWVASVLIDKLGLYTTEVYVSTREALIQRQQQDMLELSTPVVRLWKDVLALPLIGTLDSARTQVVMENLLQSIVQTESTVAIIDITGVPTVDTLVAQHLLKTITAARLMGADCIISGIRPQIAQTIVHLGVDLSGVVTKATLADAFVLALARTGQTVARAVKPAPRPQ